MHGAGEGLGEKSLAECEPFNKLEPLPESDVYALESCETGLNERKQGTDWICSVATSPHLPMASNTQRDSPCSPKFEMNLFENAFGPSATLPRETLSLLDGHDTESFAMAKPAKSGSASKSKSKRSQACSMRSLVYLVATACSVYSANFQMFFHSTHTHTHTPMKHLAMRQMQCVDPISPRSRCAMFCRCGGLAYHAES
jgi:hypothetical protein